MASALSTALASISPCVSLRAPASILCYNQLQKYLKHCTVFCLKWPVHDLVLVTPSPPFFEVAGNTRRCSKFGGTTLNGERTEVSILSHKPVTSSDLKQDRLFFRGSVSTFLQLLVAFLPASDHCLSLHIPECRISSSV